MNDDLEEILTLRAEHFCRFVGQIRDGLRAHALSVDHAAILRAAVSLYEIDDDERRYGDDGDEDDDG